MTFADKLIVLRKRQGMSQEQLAERLGVTRQSVSKWEAASSIPELSKIIALSELFGVSVDHLVKDYLEMAENQNTGERDRAGEEGREFAEHTARLEEKVDSLATYLKKRDGYEYTSKAKVAGIPLVSIRIGNRRMKMAKGIIAIGNSAMGVVGIGGFSFGVISIGGMSLGAFALGAVAAGLCAVGGAAIGFLAIGGASIGVYACGGAAVGKELAIGGAASGNTAIGREVSGRYVLQWRDGMDRALVRDFILEKCPKIWKPLADLFSFFAK